MVLAFAILALSVRMNVLNFALSVHIMMNLLHLTRLAEFAKINTEVLAISTDSEFSHLAWYAHCDAAGLLHANPWFVQIGRLTIVYTPQDEHAAQRGRPRQGSQVDACRG